MNEYGVIIGIFCFFAGLLIAYLIQGRIASRKIRESEVEADRCIKESEKKAATLIKEAELEVKDRLFKLKNEFDAETSETRAELKKRETRLMHKEENIDKKNRTVGTSGSRICPQRKAFEKKRREA
jgi:ribonuclease Y